MSSKGALSQTNKKVVQALMEMRQNNLVVFLVSPSFYLLELYAAMMRSKALFHVVKQKGGTRRWVRVFNFKNKAKLYQIGIRKGWGYPLLTKERYSFFNKYPGGDEFEKKYRNKKSETFKEEETRVDKKHKWELQRDKLLEIALEQGMTQQKIEDALKEKGADLSRSQISKIVNKKWE
jgi:NACalpha-BTF3-like transcription factor